MADRLTLPLRLYRGLTGIAAPLLARRVAGRLRAQGVAEARLGERMGRASLPRPDGRVIWFHGASVGESLSILPLLGRLAALDPDLTCLVTTGTASSAEILARRLGPGTVHQFAPLDGRRYLERFLDHWRPSLLVLVESEVWPGMLLAAEARGLSVALVNARLSEASLRGWQRFPQTARRLFGGLRLVVAQTAVTAERLVALGAAGARPGGDMKAAAAPPPADPGEVARLAALLTGRPVWAAVSTHPGEDEAVLAAQRAVLAADPAALLILVPRHPERGDRVAAMIAEAGLSLARRSIGEDPGPDTAVWLCDTLGETGLWFRLASVTLLGGSLTPVGGHNPWEPVRLGSALLHGPHVANAAPAYAALGAGGGAREVTGETLAEAVTGLLRDPAAVQKMAEAARAVADAQATSVERTATDLLALASDRT